MPLDKWDVFISHASEDKVYVEQLADELRRHQIRIWLDSHVLGWGSSLRESIDEGLKKSQFVIVVFSKAFLAKKKWTEYELSSAFALETVNEKRILPIWHGITLSDLKDYSPGLTDRLARESDKHSLSTIAHELLTLVARRSQTDSPIASKVTPLPQAITTNGAEGKTVAYIVYWTKDGKLTGLYVRKKSFENEVFSLEEPGGTMHEGTVDEIATQYFVIDRRFRREGLKISTVMASGNYPQFNLTL